MESNKTKVELGTDVLHTLTLTGDEVLELYLLLPPSSHVSDKVFALMCGCPVERWSDFHKETQVKKV